MPDRSDVFKLPVPCSNCGQPKQELARRVVEEASFVCDYCGQTNVLAGEDLLRTKIAAGKVLDGKPTDD